MKNEAWLNKKFIARANELNRINLFNLYPSESWALLPTLSKSLSVLDIGCSDGNKLPICRKINKSINYTGFDISSDLINIAKKKYASDTKSHFYVNDLTKFGNEQKNKKYDLVMSWAVLYSIDNYKNLIKKIFLDNTKKYFIFDLRFSFINEDIIDLNKSFTFYETKKNKSPYIITSYKNFKSFITSDLKGCVKNAFISGYYFNPSKNVQIKKGIKKPFVGSIILEKGNKIKRCNFIEKIPNV
jgi:hypothetical protein